MQQTTYASKRADGLEQPEERREKRHFGLSELLFHPFLADFNTF
jgi:hypothetical protein